MTSKGPTVEVGADHVLIVDDGPDERRGIVRMLTKREAMDIRASFVIDEDGNVNEVLR